MDLVVKQKEIKTTLEGAHENYIYSFDFANVEGEHPTYVGFIVSKGDQEVATGGYYVESDQLLINRYYVKENNVDMTTKIYAQITKILEDSVLNIEEIEDKSLIID